MQSFDDDAGALARATAREREPDRSTPAPTTAPSSAAGPEATTLLNLQRAVGNAGVVQLMQDDDPHGLAGLVGSGGGSPLPAETRVQMESAIGADFSDVRVHTGADADASAKSLGAHAYTAGSDVVFANGRYDPGSSDGQRTLAHELTHVVQQRSGPVDGTATGTGVKVSDPSDRFEQAAEANADRVMATQSLASGGPVASGAAGAAAPAVQRDSDEGDADVQMLAVQREGAPEEEEEPVQALAVQREGEEEEMDAG